MRSFVMWGAIIDAAARASDRCPLPPGFRRTRPHLRRICTARRRWPLQFLVTVPGAAAGKPRESGSLRAARRSHRDDAKMPDDRTPDMPDLTVRELKTEVDSRFQELKTDMDDRFQGLKTDMDDRFQELKTDMDDRFQGLKTDMDDRFQGLKTDMDDGFQELKTDMETRINEEGAATRRHFDVVAESLKGEVKILVEGCYARLDNRERRIQTLEKPRRRP
jgi:phage host-nuclease inhibitor protein Gam